MTANRPVNRSSILANTEIDADRLAALEARIVTADDRIDPEDGHEGTSADADCDRIEVRAPAVDEQIGSVPAGTAADVEAAVKRARAAQEEWAERSVTERAAVLDRCAAQLHDRRGEFLDLVQLETGKARIDALEETIGAATDCEYYARRGPELLADESRAGAIPLATTAEVVHDPVGVVGVISPWNYPMVLSIADAVPALAAGNAVVCKPDERTPYVPLAFAELLEDAGAPVDLLTVVTGEGGTVGPALIDRVEHVAFTGSTETGRVVAERAGRNLIESSLELGGKNPMVVLADADPETAARGAVDAAFSNAGQLCLSAERIYVEEPVYDAFLDAFVGATRRQTLGTGFEYGPDVGSLIGPDQLARVEEHVDLAVEAGADVLTGGRNRPDVGPFVYEPTILTGLDHDATVAREETFGPVVSVWPVADVDEAVERANDSEYGLNGSVWTGDRERGRAVARRIDCGTVCVNDAYAVGWGAVDAPMGGVGDSGLGRRHGREGIERFVESRTIATSRVGPIGPHPRIPDRWYAGTLACVSDLTRRLRRWWP